MAGIDIDKIARQLCAYDLHVKDTDIKRTLDNIAKLLNFISPSN